MKNTLSLLFLTVISAMSAAHAADFCVTGIKGTVTSNYIFKVSKQANGDRTLALLDSNTKTPVIMTKAENRFTQFNSTGYGVCSITATGIDEQNGAQYNAELKVSPHFKSACNQVTIPTSIEYATLKIVPKGTTLGDDLTAYALSIIPCP